MRQVEQVEPDIQTAGRTAYERRARYFALGAATLALSVAVPASAQQLPTGGAVTSGNATISTPQNGTLNVNQSSNTAIINWQTFSIGQGGTVNFNQPSASSATLNRVLGSTPSSIAGTINAPGTVLLVNPNGIAITSTGVVNVGSFAASTLDIKDSDFLAGNYKFTGNGGSAAVINGGRINVSDGGFAALLGGQVTNNGIISARLGKVGLGAGELMTLDLAGDGFLQVEVPSSQLGKLVDPNGALVTNRGKIHADGGTVFLSAATAANLLRNAVNIPGAVRANTVGARDGRIVINGGTGGKVSVTGRLAAKGRKDGEKGGRIDVAGAHIALTGAVIDASGASGGGLVRIGGTFQGGGADPTSPLYSSFIGRFGNLPDIASAETVVVDGATRIDISAKKAGDAGSAVIWSNDTTTFAGTVTGVAAGSGHGGFVEVSGKQHLATSGSFDLRSTGGKFGTLLFDPGSINIVHGGNSYAGADTLNDGYLNGLLASADVIVDTNYATGANGASGDITLKNGAAISWSADTTLTLNAARNIVFEGGSSIFTNAGSVVLAAGNNASGVGTVTFQGSGAQITETGGGNVTAYYNPAVFGTANFNSAGVSGNLTAYMLVNSPGQVNAINNNLSGNYALARNIDFGTYNICDFNCFGVTYLEPLGTFNGQLDGRNHTINFTVYSSGNFNQGMFTSIGSSGVIRNLNVTARIFSGFTIGGLAGTNSGMIINSSANTNARYAFDPNNALTIGNIKTGVVGGLVGSNSGTITNSSATLSTTGGGDGVGTNVGGLVGINSGTITGSYSTGGTLHPEASNSNFNSSIEYKVGGLVGLNTGLISTSWSSAFISDTGLGIFKTYDGGFVGYNQGTISNSYATGTVNGGTYVGGFVGTNQGIINTSFSTGAAFSNPGNGYSGNVGGFAGLNGIIFIGLNVNALPAAQINQSWTSSPVSGTVTPLLRGFAALDGATNAGNYFDVTATGQTVAAMNIFGHDCTTCNTTAIPTTAQAYNIGFYSNAFKDAGWFIRNFYTRPIQTAFRTTTISASDPLLAAMQLELVGSTPGQNITYVLARDIDLSIVQSSTMWSSRGWGPIGQNGGQFSGTFDGQGHTISNIYINTQDVNENGLFGYSDGTIKNVGLVGGSITGVQVVGSIAGNNYGTIQDVYSSVNVTGYNNVGGLVGVNNGAISRSFVTGDVNGTIGNGSSATGGLVGYNFGNITDAYATGNVTGATIQPNQFAGGIAGVNNGTISNVYYTGTVTGNAGGIGALVGNNTSQTEMNTGDPDYNVYYVTTNHVINTGYWNSDSMGGTGVGGDGHGSGTLNGGGPLRYAQMTDQNGFASTFAGFNFNTIWSPPNQPGQGGAAVAHTPGLYGASNIIWLEAANVTRTYGNNGSALSYTLHGLRAGDPQWLIAGLSLTSPVTTTTDVGTFNLSFGSPQATGRNGRAYRFTTSGTETVTQRLLGGAVTIAGIDKIYDGNTSAAGGAATLSAANNVVNGDVVILSATAGTYQTADVSGGLQTVALNGVALNNANYALAGLTYSGTGTISPKTVTTSLTGSVTKVYDGTDTATLTSGNYTGLVGVIGADVGSVSLTSVLTGTFANANAGSPKQVSVTGLQLTGAKAGNYIIASSLSGNIGSITQRALNGSASIAGIDKIYDSTTTAAGGAATLTGGFNNVVAGDTVIVSAASGTYATANVTGGTQVVTVNSVSVNNPNYTVGSLNFAGTGRITPAALQVTAATATKTYNGNTSSTGLPTVTGGTLFGTDTGNFTQAFLSQHVLGAGQSTLRASGAVNDGNGGQNYTITFIDAAGTITPKALTIAAVTDNRSYDGTKDSAGAPQATGLVIGDSISGFTQSFASRNATAVNGATLAVNVGSGTVNDGNNGNNYAVTFQNAQGTISQAQITVTAVTETRTYDGTRNSSYTPTVTSGTVFSGDTENFTQSFASKNVLGAGGSTINAAGLVSDGNGGGNYNVTFVSAAGTITKAPLTVSAVTDTRTYDGTQTSSLTPTVTGGTVFSGDTESFTQSFAERHVRGTNGSTINAFGIVNDGNGGNNYNVTFVSALGTINPAPITVTAATQTKVYDADVVSSGTPAVTGGQLFGTDAGNFTQAFLSRHVLGAGQSTLRASGMVNDGNNGQNYTITFVDTAGTITPKALTIAAVTDSRSYDGTRDSIGAPQATGLVIGESISGFTQSFTSKNATAVNGATLAVNAGSGTVNDGNNGNNYLVAFQTAQGTISQAQITVAAVAETRTYDGTQNSSFTPTVTSGTVFSGDSENFTQSFASKNVLGAGGSTINAVGVVNDGNGGANYNVTFVSAAGTITKAALTVAAVTDTRTYDGTQNSSLTPVVTGGTVFSGDTESFTQSFAERHVRGTNGSTINAAGIVNDGNGGGNYDVSFLSALGTINPAPITVTAATQTKVYDADVVSSGTPTVTGGQIFGTDAGNFAQEFLSRHVLGAGQSTLRASGTANDGNGGQNYTITFVDTAGTINPAALTITAISNTKTYDTNTSATAVPTYSGVKGSDTVTGLSEVYDNANVGTGKTLSVATYQVNDGNGGNNYAVTTVANTSGIITPATLTYVADPKSRFTSASNPPFTGSVTGFVGADTLTSATTGTLQFDSPANAFSPPGKYAIDGFGLAAVNYVFTQAAGNATALSVDQLPLNPASQAKPSGDGNTPSNNLNIAFQNNAVGVTPISFTPRLATTNRGDISPASLPQSAAGDNNGFVFQPISQYDPNQYSEFKLPGYEDRAGQAALFAIIARAIASDQAANFLIDAFWNGSDAGWKDPRANGSLVERVTFSNGSGGGAVTPEDGNAFPIVAGSTDLGAMLKDGPVMIGGPQGQTPQRWVLAIKLTDDGKGVIAADPVSGKLVVLSYDQNSKSLGGIVGLFDPKTKGLVQLADASGAMPAGSGGIAVLQNFVPSTFFAVTIKR